MKIKRFALAINHTNGDIVESINLDTLSKEEKNLLLNKIFTQSLQRLGYDKLTENNQDCITTRSIVYDL